MRCRSTLWMRECERECSLFIFGLAASESQSDTGSLRERDQTYNR